MPGDDAVRLLATLDAERQAVGRGCPRVAQSYIRPATIFVNNATDGLGDGLGDEPEKKR